METIQIPNKSHFKLTEVCGLTGVKPYVLRYWEAEFLEIDPVLSSSGQKLYDHKDIETIAIVKKLLFEEKMTIEEARRELQVVQARKEIVDTPDDECPDFPPTPVQRVALEEHDLEKIAAVKELLKGIFLRTESIKKVHHWF